MAHKPICIKNLSLELPHKVCFSDFCTQILPGERIGIIGRNGSGKTTLVNMLLGKKDSSGGTIDGLDGLGIGYVPQIVSKHNELSGGQRFNKALSEALSKHPDILILDEPTNHLDQNTKYSLMRMLDEFLGTLFIVTHDIDVLTKSVDKIWHLENGKISVFYGNYRDYMDEKDLQLSSQQKTLDILQKEKKKLKIQRQQESQKSAKAGKKQAKDNDKLGFKAKANNARAKSDAKLSKIKDKLSSVSESMSQNRLAVEYNPNFILPNAYVHSEINLLSVSFGECGYGSHMVLSGVFFFVGTQDKVAIVGNNASGKTTFLRAIMQDSTVCRIGDWSLPNPKDIGYLEQHYENLNPDSTVEDVIKDKNPLLDSKDIRKHLNSFLFRKNEEVFAMVKTLSGGEKARLSLAQIAACPPKLLILDEITNNIDIETKEYIVSVLRAYPGAMIIISHEQAFLDRLNLTSKYFIQNGTLRQKLK